MDSTQRNNQPSSFHFLYKYLGTAETQMKISLAKELPIYWTLLVGYLTAGLMAFICSFKGTILPATAEPILCLLCLVRSLPSSPRHVSAV